MGNFFIELKRRNVIRVAVAYLALGWLVLQVAGLVIPAFGIPAWALRLLIIVVALGFPVALVVSWVYELTPEGLRRESGTSASRLTGRKLDFIIIGVLVAVVGLLLLERLVLTPRSMVSSAKSAATVPRANPVEAPAQASIAVLPFVDMSQARDQEYFSDGLSEELLNLLARIPQLHVAGRTSSFSFKGRNEDLKSIGQKLGVATILEGSVRKSGERLRITAQLINAADGFHLWSETYDRELTDVFAVQDEIAAAVVAALKVKLLPGQGAASARGRTASPDAYNQYLLGNQLSSDPSTENARRAVEAYRKAIALDPDYAAAYAGLSVAMATRSLGKETSAGQRAQEQGDALVAADRAIALDPGLAEGYSARGYVRRLVNWDWAGAQADLERAISLDPTNSQTQLRYGLLLSSLGRVPETIAALERMAALDPLSASAWRYLGLYLAFDGRIPEARTALARSLEILPDNALNHYWVGVTEMLAGRADIALKAFTRSSEELRLSGIAIAEHDLGNEEASQQALEELVQKYAATSATQIAHVHAWRGERDQAFQWLDRAYAQHEPALMYLKANVLLRKLEDDPRYAALVAKTGLPP